MSRPGPFALGKVQRSGIAGLWAAVTAAAMEDLLYGAASYSDIDEWLGSWVGDAMSYGSGISKPELRRIMYSLADMYADAANEASDIRDARARHYFAYKKLAGRLGVGCVSYWNWKRIVSISDPTWFNKANTGPSGERRAAPVPRPEPSIEGQGR